MVEQIAGRCALREGETWEAHNVYARSLKSLKPILKNVVQRTTCCVMVALIISCVLPYDVLPDVMVVTMPLARPPEMAEVVVSMFAPELEGSEKEQPPKEFVLANLIDPLACEGLLQNLPQLLRDMGAIEASRNEVARLPHQASTAIERTAELLRTQLNSPAILVSPPDLMSWGCALQQFVFMLTEVCSVRQIDFFICASNLRVGMDDLRPAAHSARAYLAATSCLLQTTELSGNAQLTWDAAILYDHGMQIDCLTFDHEGHRLLRDATLAERARMR